MTIILICFGLTKIVIYSRYSGFVLISRSINSSDCSPWFRNRFYLSCTTAYQRICSLPVLLIISYNLRIGIAFSIKSRLLKQTSLCWMNADKSMSRWSIYFLIGRFYWYSFLPISTRWQKNALVTFAGAYGSNFRILKFHLLGHVTAAIRKFGNPVNFNTASWEVE